MSQSVLTGRKARVPGDAQNLGAAMAKALTQAGAVVVLGDLNAEAGEATVAALQDAGADATPVHLGVTDAASWNAALPSVQWRGPPTSVGEIGDCTCIEDDYSTSTAPATSARTGRGRSTVPPTTCAAFMSANPIWGRLVEK